MVCNDEGLMGYSLCGALLRARLESRFMLMLLLLLSRLLNVFGNMTGSPTAIQAVSDNIFSNKVTVYA